MDKEDTDGRKLIDDGVSTVLALRRCHAAYQANKETTPEGDVWPQSLMSIFSSGLSVRVVAYEDDDDREVREAWNTAKHDEESNTIRWSTLYQKMNTAVARFKKLGDWSKVTSSLLEFYGPSKRTTVGRWVRAAKGMNPKVLEEIKPYPSLKGTYLWDNPYLVYSASVARSQLTPEYVVKALGVLKERLASSESMSGERFQNQICKPMKIVEVWQNLMKKRYGSVASGSLALERLVGSLTQWVGLQTVLMCAQTGVVLHGESSEKQGIPDCYLLKKEFDKCHAGGLPPPPQPHPHSKGAV